MKPETADLFEKARRLLTEADLMLEVGLFEAAGRNAYLSGCCAARGLIFEDGNKVVNRHKRLWGDLMSALRARGMDEPQLSAFLPNAYSLKRIADYETGSSEITKERAEKAVTEATVYVEKLRHIAGTLPQNPLQI